MALSEADIAALRAAREARRTEEFLTAYKARVEESRLYHERQARRREPTWARMHEPFNF